jgi:hypothetical protein
MKKILVSKPNVLLLGGMALFILIIFGPASVVMAIKGAHALQEGKEAWGLFIAPLIFGPGIIYAIYYLLTIAPQLTIDSSGIRLSTVFKTKYYAWSEIESIALTGKQYISFLFNSTPAEAITFKLKNEKTIFIWPDYYRNSPDLQVVLERANNLLHTETSTPFEKLDFTIKRTVVLQRSIDSRNATEYNGNHIFTINGFMLYGFTAVMLCFVLFTFKKGVNNWLVAVIFLITFIMDSSFIYQMHYFMVSKEFLLVRNTVWFWRRRAYALENIREVVIETPSKKSTSLRIITKDFESKLYSAGSLSEETWKTLEQNLIHKGIMVRNESNV